MFCRSGTSSTVRILAMILWVVAGSAVIAMPRMAAADFVGHGAPVRDIALSPDGRYAATAGFDDLAILWSVSERSQLARFYGHGAGVNAVAFLPIPEKEGRGGEGSGSEARLPRVVSVSDDGTGRIWDGESGRTLFTLDGHEKKVVDVAVSPDGSTIATASWDRTVRLWDAEDGTMLRVIDAHRNSVNALAFTPEGDAVVSAGYGGEIHVHPRDPDKPSYRFASVGFPINAIALSHDGRTLVTGSADKILRVWNMETRELRKELAGHHQGAVLSVAIGENGRNFASAGVGGNLYLWDGGEAPRLTLRIEHYRAVWSLAFSPDGARIYAAGVDSVVRGWEVASGKSVIGKTTQFKPVERVPRKLASSDSPIERGSYQFRKCAICHALEEGDDIPRSGPNLAGLFGRRAGTYPGYDYSESLEESGIHWTAETIDRLFDIGPDRMFPGTKMPIQKLADPSDRRDLVEFLRHATAKNENK